MTLDQLETEFLVALQQISGEPLTWDIIEIVELVSLGGTSTQATVQVKESAIEAVSSYVGVTTVVYDRIDISNQTLVIDSERLWLLNKSAYTTQDILNHLKHDSRYDFPASEFKDVTTVMVRGANTPITLEPNDNSFYFVGSLQGEIVFPKLPYVDYTLELTEPFDLQSVIRDETPFEQYMVYIDNELATNPMVPAGTHRVVIYGIDTQIDHTKIPATVLHKLYLQGLSDLRVTSYNTPVLSNTIVSVDTKAIYSEAAHLTGLFYGNPNPISVPALLFEYLGPTVKTEGLFAQTGITTIPGTVFSNIKLRTLFRAFEGCSQLTALPDGLFKGQTELTNANRTFSRCGFTEVPANLLGDCVKLSDVAYLFSYSKVSRVLGPLGEHAGIEQASSLFVQCKLTELSEDVFKGLTKLTTLYNAFYNCTFENLIVTERMFIDCTALTSVESIFYNSTGIDRVVTPWVNSPLVEASNAFLRTDVKTVVGPLTRTTQALNATSMFESCTQLTEVSGILFDTATVKNISRLFTGCTNLTKLEYVFNPVHTLSALEDVSLAMSSTGVETFQDLWLGGKHTNPKLTADSLLYNSNCTHVGKTLDFGESTVTINAGRLLCNNKSLKTVSPDFVVGANTTLRCDGTRGIFTYNTNIRITTGELIAAFNVKGFEVTNPTTGVFEGTYWLDGNSTDVCARYGVTVSVAAQQRWFIQCFRLNDYFSNYRSTFKPEDYPNLDLVANRGWSVPISLTSLPLPAPYDRDGFPWVPYFRTVRLVVPSTKLTAANTLEKRISLLSTLLDYDLTEFTWYTAPFTAMPFGFGTSPGDVYSLHPLPAEITEFEPHHFILWRR